MANPCFTRSWLLTVRHPAAVATILFAIVFAGFALGPLLGLPHALGRYWAGEFYILVFGGAFLYLSLSDRKRKKLAAPKLDDPPWTNADLLDVSSHVLRSDPKIRRKEILSISGFMIIPLFVLLIVLATVGPLVRPGTVLSDIWIIAITVSPFVILFEGDRKSTRLN